MPLVSCITINRCGKRQAIFVRRLVNFPDSFARLDKLSKLQQHCEQQTLEGWILLTSLPISGSGAARVCLSGTSSQNDVLARSAEQKLGLGASGHVEGKNCLLIFTVRNIAGKCSEPVLRHCPFLGLSLDFLAVDYGPSQPLLHSLCQLCLEERQSLGLAKSLPNLLTSKGGFKELLVKAQSTCRESSKSFWEALLEETKLGLSKIKACWDSGQRA